MWLLSLVLLSAAPASAENRAPDLTDLLQRLGADEAERHAHPTPCAFREVIKTEELDDRDNVWGWMAYVKDVEQQGLDLTSKVVEVNTGGHEIDSRMKPKRDEELTEDDKRRRREFRSQFYPDQQPKYRYTLQTAADPRQVTITFEPKEPTPERFRGSAVVDVETAQLLSVDVVPAQLPAFISRLQTHLEFVDTACGRQLSRMKVRGAGGVLFVRKFFRSATERSDFRPLNTAKN